MENNKKLYTFWSPEAASSRLFHPCDTYINFLIAEAIYRNKLPEYSAKGHSMFTQIECSEETSKQICLIATSECENELLSHPVGKLHLEIFLCDPENKDFPESMAVLPMSEKQDQVSSFEIKCRNVGVLLGIQFTLDATSRLDLSASKSCMPTPKHRKILFGARTGNESCGYGGLLSAEILTPAFFQLFFDEETSNNLALGFKRSS